MRSIAPFAVFLFVAPFFIFSDWVGVLPDVITETNLFLLGSAAVGVALYHRYRRIPWRVARDPFLPPILLLILALGVSVLGAPYLWDALRGWTLVFVGGLVYFAVSRTPLDPEDRPWLFRAVAVCSALALAYSLYRHFQRPTPAQIRDFMDTSLMTEEMRRKMMFALLLGRAKALFGNPNQLAAWTNLLAAGPVAVLLFDRDRSWRAACALLLAGQGLLLYLTASRGGMLSFAAALLVVAVLWLRLQGKWRTRSRRRLIRGFLILFAAGATALLVLVLLGRLRWLFQSQTLETRVVWWKAAAGLVVSHPWGVGPRMFPLFFPAVRAIGAPESQFVHDLFLEWALAGGPFAVLALFWLQVAALFTAWRLTRPERDEAGAGAAAITGIFAVTAFSVHASFDFIQARPEIALFFWFFLGVLGAPAVSGATRARTGRRGAAWAVPVLVVAWIFLLVIPWKGMSRLAEGKAAIEEIPPRIIDAEGLFDAARTWLPLSASPWYFLACNRFYTAHDPEAAIPLMREAVRRDPRMAHYHGTLAEMLWAAGQREEALDEVSTAIGLHPARGSYYLQRSRFRAAMGDETGAARDRELGEVREEADRAWVPDLEKIRARP